MPGDVLSFDSLILTTYIIYTCTFYMPLFLEKLMMQKWLSRALLPNSWSGVDVLQQGHSRSFIDFIGRFAGPGKDAVHEMENKKALVVSLSINSFKSAKYLHVFPIL